MNQPDNTTNDGDAEKVPTESSPVDHSTTTKTAPRAREAAATPPIVLPSMHEARAAVAPRRPETPAGDRQRTRVHVAPDLLDLVSVSTTPEEASARKQQRDLNQVVHAVLIVGLVLSTALMLIGLGLSLLTERKLPETVPEVGEVVRQVVALRPSGFLALGLLVLIATPILRVIGSIGVFLYERDWRFAGISTLVFIIMLTSILLGHG